MKMSTVHFSKSFETLVSVFNAGGMAGAGVLELKVGDVLTLPEDFNPNPDVQLVKSEQILSFMGHALVVSLAASSHMPQSILVFTQITGWDDDMFPEGYGDLFGGFDLPESTMQAGGTYKVKEILKTEVAEDSQWDSYFIGLAGGARGEYASKTGLCAVFRYQRLDDSALHRSNDGGREMKLEELVKYQAWRTGAIDKSLDELGLTPAKITACIDWAIKYCSESQAECDKSHHAALELHGVIEEHRAMPSKGMAKALCLAAQVDALKNHLSSFGGTETLEDAIKWEDDIKRLVSDTPEQHLADHDAEVAKAAFIEGYDSGYQAGRIGADNHSIEDAADYAAQLRTKAGKS